MDYNEVWFSRSTFHEKAKKNIYRVFYFFYKDQKRRFLLKLPFLAFLARSSERENMFWRLRFNIFKDIFRNPKILQESYHILSQYGAT